MFKLILFLILLLPIKVNASAYIVMDMDNNRVLEGNNIHAPHLKQNFRTSFDNFYNFCR